MSAIQIEANEPFDDRPSCVVVSVYLGKFYVGGVHRYYDDRGEIRYYGDMSLPMQPRNYEKQPKFDFGGDTSNQQTALDNLLVMVQQWISDAGLEATRAHLADIEPLDVATREKWRGLALWAEEINTPEENPIQDLLGFANQVAIHLPAIVKRAIDCGFRK